MLEHVVAEEAHLLRGSASRQLGAGAALDRMRQFAVAAARGHDVDLAHSGQHSRVIETLVGELTSLYEELETKHGEELMRRASSW